MTERRGDIPQAHAALTLRIMRARREQQLVVGVTVDELDAWNRTIADLIAVADSHYELTAKIEQDERKRQAKAAGIMSRMMRA